MISINEVLPNPIGTDSGNEWLELYNDTSQVVYIEGWHLTVNGKSVALHGSVPATGYRTINSKDVKRSLTNREAKLGLYDANGRLADSLHLYGSAHEGKSFSRFEDGLFHWADPTPAAVNSVKKLDILTEPAQPFGVNLVPHTSFTHSLGSGILLALVLSCAVTGILSKSHALPQFITRDNPQDRHRHSGAS